MRVAEAKVLRRGKAVAGHRLIERQRVRRLPYIALSTARTFDPPRRGFDRVPAPAAQAGRVLQLAHALEIRERERNRHDRAVAPVAMQVVAERLERGVPGLESNDDRAVILRRQHRVGADTAIDVVDDVTDPDVAPQPLERTLVEPE